MKWSMIQAIKQSTALEINMEVKKKNNCGVFAKLMRLFLMQVESANNKNNQNQ